MFILFLTLPGHSLAYRGKQVLRIEGLVKEAMISGSHGALLVGALVTRSDEDDRQVGQPKPGKTPEFKAINDRHAYIRDEAINRCKGIIIEQFLGRREQQG
jgi:hypothetical protein